MHEYVATSIKRHLVVRTLASISIATSIALGVLFHQLKLPSYIAPPTGVAFFVLVFWLYNQYLWRPKIGSPIPDLRGTWEGTVDIRKGEDVKAGEDKARAEPAAEEVPEELECTVLIKQTWTAISIEFETDKTESHSVTAALGPTGPDGLHYEYNVTVEHGKKLERNSQKTEDSHFGTAHLKPVRGSWDTLKGYYYNDRAFQRWGEYKIKRVSRRVQE